MLECHTTLVALRDFLPSTPVHKKTTITTLYLCNCLPGDLAGMKPEYLCNTVANNWQKEPSGNSDAFELLTLSPTGIERLDESPDEYSSFAG